MYSEERAKWIEPWETYSHLRSRPSFMHFVISSRLEVKFVLNLFSTNFTNEQFSWTYNSSIAISTLLTERKIVDFMVHGAFGTLNDRKVIEL